MVWCGAVWCGAVRCCVVWCGAVRCCVVWCGAVRCRVVWYGVWWVWCVVYTLCLCTVHFNMSFVSSSCAVSSGMLTVNNKRSW